MAATSADRIKTCPICDVRMAAKRYIGHLVKCKERNPETAANLFVCPFNAKHRVPVHEQSSHLLMCQRRQYIEADNLSLLGPPRHGNLCPAPSTGYRSQPPDELWPSVHRKGRVSHIRSSSDICDTPVPPQTVVENSSVADVSRPSDPTQGVSTASSDEKVACHVQGGASLASTVASTTWHTARIPSNADSEVPKKGSNGKYNNLSVAAEARLISSDASESERKLDTEVYSSAASFHSQAEQGSINHRSVQLRDVGEATSSVDRKPKSPADRLSAGSRYSASQTDRAPGEMKCMAGLELEQDFLQTLTRISVGRGRSRISTKS